MAVIKQVEINKTASAFTLRGMVARVNCKNDSDTLSRCAVVERWVRGNEVITDAEFDELMSAVNAVRDQIHTKREAARAAAFADFAPVGDKENPLPIREYREQAQKAGCDGFPGELEMVAFDQVQFYDITIYRDKCGNLWEDRYFVGD